MPPEDNSPAGAPATGATGTPEATGNAPVSQGPNDPINPPATGGSAAPATGDKGSDNPLERRLSNLEQALSRVGTERDEARRALEEEKRKGLSPEDRQRLADQDKQIQTQKERERNLILRYEIASRAPRLGIVDPEIAVLLLERSPGVTVADDGTVTGIDEALKQLIKDRPHLARSAALPVDAGAGVGGTRTGGKVTMNDIIRRGARGQSISTE